MKNKKQGRAKSLSKNTDSKNQLISIALTILVLTALGVYLYNNQDVFDSLSNISLSQILGLAAIYFIFILALSYLNKIIFHKLKPEINTWEIVGLQYINTLLNKILPKGGVAFRAVYLKQHYELAYSQFLVTFAGVVVVNIASQALFSLAALSLIYVQTGYYNLLITLGFITILAGTLFIILFQPSISSNNNWFFRAVKQMVDGWNIITENPKEVAYLIGISVVVLVIDTVNMYLIFYAINSPIDIFEAVILSSLSIILSYINITPDGLGIREGVYLYIASILTISEPLIIVGSLVQRAIALLTSIVFGGISYGLIVNWRNKRNRINEP